MTLRTTLRNATAFVLATFLATACSETGGSPAAPQSAGGLAPAGVAGSVTGSAHWEFDFGVPVPPGLATRNLVFSAVERDDGRVTGEWNIVVGGTILHGAIDCMEILPDGETARIAGIVEQAKFTSFQPGTAFGLLVVDDGQGAKGGDETSNVLSFRNEPPEVGREFCENGTFPGSATTDEILHGNFQVRGG